MWIKPQFRSVNVSILIGSGSANRLAPCPADPTVASSATDSTTDSPRSRFLEVGFGLTLYKWKQGMFKFIGFNTHSRLTINVAPFTVVSESRNKSYDTNVLWVSLSRLILHVINPQSRGYCP